MNAFIGWLENSFAPKLQKVANLTWIVIIKDSLMQCLPFILAGSLFCCFAILNNYIDWLPSFWTPFGWTMGKLSLMVPSSSRSTTARRSASASSASSPASRALSSS